jgi:hypothetical protein
MGTLGDIPSDLARWYARRLRYLWTTSVNEGLGFFIIYTILIATAAVLLQKSISLRHDDENRLDEFLQSDHQVRDADRYVSALSVVLSAIRPAQRINQGTCPPDSAECRRARNVINSTVQFAGLIAGLAAPVNKAASPETPLTARPGLSGAEQIAAVKAILGSNHLYPEAASVATVAIQRGIDVLKIAAATKGTDVSVPGGTADSAVKAANSPYDRAAACEPSLETAGEAEREQSRRDQFGLHRAVCQRPGSDVSGLQIPEQNAEFGFSDVDVNSRMEDRIARAVGVSFALEAALRAATSRPVTERVETCSCCSIESDRNKCDQNAETRTFTAAYFVSIDSVLRYWREETVDPVMLLPKNLLWATREYFTTYGRGDTAADEEYVSQPYIDIAGAGIVQTICRAVPARLSSDDVDKPTRIAGVVCADLALRQDAVKSLVTYIQGGPLVSAGLVRISAKGNAIVEPEPDNGHLAELQKVTESTDWGDAFPPGWIAGPQSRGTTRLRVDSHIWYVVPIARSGTNVLAIALQPAPSSGVGRLFRWAVLGSICGAALVLLTFTAHQSRRVSIAGRDLARLRGLPIAVIESRIDPKMPEDYSRQIVVAGNDRAEEVLQIRLANFGLTVGARPTLGDLFDPEKLVPTGLDNSEPLKEFIDSKDIVRSRRRGDTNTYYARLRARRTVWRVPTNSQEPDAQEYQWVRLSAGPVILPRSRGASLEARGRLESTLGIIVPVMDQKLSQALDDIEWTHSQSQTTRG